MAAFRPDDSAGAGRSNASWCPPLNQPRRFRAVSFVVMVVTGFRAVERQGVRSAGDGFTVIDGGSAFKPGVAGFAVLEEKSREDAIENGKRLLRVMGGGECEMLPLMNAPPRP